MLLPLWECWAALYNVREKREPLDLDLPERRIVLDEMGRILSVAPRERLDGLTGSGKTEVYFEAVAAAKALETKKASVIVSRARVAEPREAGRAQGLSQDAGCRIRAGAGDLTGDIQPRPCARGRSGVPRRSDDSSAVHADPGLKTPGISAFRWAAMPTSPRRSSAIPTWSCIAHWWRRTSLARPANCCRIERWKRPAR